MVLDVMVVRRSVLEQEVQEQVTVVWRYPKVLDPVCMGMLLYQSEKKQVSSWWMEVAANTEPRRSPHQCGQALPGRSRLLQSRLQETATVRQPPRQ